MIVPLPKAQSKITDPTGIPTREWYNYFRSMLESAEGNPALEAQIQAILIRLEALEEGGTNFQLQGLDSVVIYGTPANGFVKVTLDGDTSEQGGSWYYGSGPDSVKGWYRISDTLEVDSGELTKSVDLVTGITTFGLESVPDGGVAPTLLKVTRDGFGRVNNTQAATASDVPIAKLGSATWDNVQEAINVQNSPGLIDGGSFSDAGSGNLSYSAMHIAIRPTDSDTATLYMADIAAGVIAIPNDSATRFVGVQYNGGSPNVIIKTADSWDYDTEFPLGEVANLGGTLYPLFNPYKVGDPITNVIQRFDAQAYAIRSAAGGLELSTDGTTRNLAMTAGVVWTRLNDHPIAARNSPTFPLIRITPTGGTPPLAFTPGFTAWPNTQYISGTTLTTLGNNKWANLWVFVNIGTGAWGFAHGTAEYNNSSSAAAEAIPAYLTSNFLRQNIFVGRIIFEKNATTAIIESAFTRVFSTQAVSNHNQLSGLQGGVLNEYYHNTSAQHVTVSSLSVSGYIEGLNISWNNSSSITVSSGTASIQSLGGCASFPSPITKSGLSLTASTWYHVYGYLNSGTPDIEVVTTSPTSPFIGSARSKTGDNSRRYLGSIKTNASSQIIEFVVDSSGAFRYLIGNNVAPLRCLANGTAITRTAVSLSGAIPVTSNSGIFIISNIDTGVFANISIPTAASASVVGIAPAGALAGQILTFPTDSAQAIDYYYSTSPASGLYIDVVGFYISR